jgi:ABC-type branched-subunit amino acid transport system ATPase component/predicted MFS family arabinose efflux permease
VPDEPTRARAPKRLGALVGGPTRPLVVLALLALLEEFERTAFSIVLPTVRRSVGNIDGALFLAGTVTVIVVVSAIPLGHLSDRVHRMRLAAGGAAAWGVATVITAAAATGSMLLLGRAGSGIARATRFATHDAVISDHHHPERRPAALAVHRSALSLAQVLAAASVGVLAFYFTWRTPLAIVGALAILLALVAAFRVEEPPRGTTERRLGGASEPAIATEEAPAGFDEAWRMLGRVGSVRRLWVALPFLGIATVGTLPLVQLVFSDVFGLTLSERTSLAAVTGSAQFLGYVVAVPLALTIMRRAPERLVSLVGGLGVVTAVLLVAVAAAPSVAVATVFAALLAAARAGIDPMIAAAVSLVLPPRVRSLGFATTAVLLLPAEVMVVPIVDSVGWGARGGLVVMAGFLLVGCYLAAAAGPHLATDIARVRAAAAAGSEVRAARERGESKLVVVRDLDVSYSGVQVLFGVDFEVDEGEIVALLGTNGAGKSTLLKAISGMVDVDGGAVIFDGHDITFAPPNEVVAKGVLQVPGGRGVFGSLTVAENLRAAAWLYRHDPRHQREAVTEVLRRFPRLRERWHQPAAQLSGGEQQMLTLGMAFISRPRLLMIDELSLGLAPTIVEQLLQMVELIREGGTTIIVVEQSVNMALTIAEKAFFMEKGEIRFEGPTADLLERPDILRSVFLEGASSVARPESPEGPEAVRSMLRAHQVRVDARPGEVPPTPVMEARNLTKLYGVYAAVDDVGLVLEPGRSLGVIGPNGAGKTTLFDLLSGHARPSHGRIVFEGIDITDLSADARARRGVGRSFQDAWLFPGLTVAETITLACERRRNVELVDPVAAAMHLPGVTRWERRVGARTDELVELMGLGAYRDKFVSELSTGSRRMVDLACMVAQEPAVILLDEPSSGIAQRETEALGPVLRQIRMATGAAMLVIEHDMSLVTEISDELVALDRGSVVTRGAPRQVLADERVVASYLGTTPEVIARSGSVVSDHVTSVNTESI